MTVGSVPGESNSCCWIWLSGFFRVFCQYVPWKSIKPFQYNHEANGSSWTRAKSDFARDHRHKFCWLPNWEKSALRPWCCPVISSRISDAFMCFFWLIVRNPQQDAGKCEIRMVFRWYLHHISRFPTGLYLFGGCYKQSTIQCLLSPSGLSQLVVNRSALEYFSSSSGGLI